jgi:hypothetical protein
MELNSYWSPPDVVCHAPSRCKKRHGSPVSQVARYAVLMALFASVMSVELDVSKRAVRAAHSDRSRLSPYATWAYGISATYGTRSDASVRAEIA